MMIDKQLERVGLRESFERYARIAGAQVQFVADEGEVAAAFVADGTPLKCSAVVRDKYPGFYGTLVAAGIVTMAEDVAATEPDRSALAAALAGGTGIVLARAGVAETGSLVLADDGLAPRLLAMLADTCVVLLPAEALLPDLDSAGLLLSELNAAGQRYVSLVTGPSRTADIERVLTIGVQGPKTLQIIVIGKDGN